MSGIENALNEGLKRNNHDIIDWQNNEYKDLGIKLSDENINEINEYLKEEMLNRVCPTNLFDRFDKDTIINIAGYIIEADIYDAFKKAFNEFIEHNQNVLRKYNIFNRDSIKATKLAGRGLSVKSANNDRYPIYWDFSIFGVNEKFEIKTKCLNGYHEGGINYTSNQRKYGDFIVIYCTYSVDEESKTYEIENITVKRYLK